MKVINERGQRVPIYVWTDEMDSGSLEQAVNLSKLPFVSNHVALMPDVHQGYGMPIGGVIACDRVVVPNAVGVDIGCGMIAVKTSLSVYDFPQEDLPKMLREVCNTIHRSVPVGFNVHNGPQGWDGFENYLDNINIEPGWSDLDKWSRITKSLGTLGGGNHFIEIQRELSQHGEIWLMIHSGSRYLGKIVCDYYNEIAKKNYGGVGSDVRDLAYLPVESDLGQLYLRDMNFSLDFAQENREAMLCEVKHAIVDVLGAEVEQPVVFDEPINIHHNYASLERHYGEDLWVHRKGATSAKKGQLGIIPGSMGSSSYIVEGKGNPLSFESCSHGAGRRMGRMEASRTLDHAECELLMDGIVYDGFGRINRGKLKGSKDLGESPLAYKDIDTVIENQRDLVKVLHELKPIANVKG